jgi:DmsE family decaheme c-type cytochrome
MALICAAPAFAQPNVKMKSGVKGKRCLDCHEEFKKTLKSRSVHPLLKRGDCTGCHDPHTSKYKNLLISDVTTLCKNCHEDKVPEKARSAHKLVVEGNCITCHNSHGSANRFNLNKSGNELCFECHKDVGTQSNAVKFKHDPLKTGKGCLNCHNPHASTRSDYLLKREVPALCKGCHKTNRTLFKKRHLNYQVDGSECDSCHSTHGSNKRGILYDDVHQPVAEKKCTQCHPGPGASKPLKTKLTGTRLCRQCHKTMINQTFSKNRVHWPLADNKGCSNCHNPHGGKTKKHLNNTQFKVCGKCHEDTVKLQEWSIQNPKNKNLCVPVKTGDCAACHSPHAADNVLLISQENISKDLCGKCHEWQSHSTHPIGEKAIDQRNKNLTVECLSCHLGCGTGNKPWMMPYETTYDLCTQCHIERRR